MTDDKSGFQVKTKGVRLTAAAAEIVTPETMEDLIANRHKEVRVPQWQIGRRLNQGLLFSRDYLKRLRFSSSKRVILSDSPHMDSLPYGYIADA